MSSMTDRFPMAWPGRQPQRLVDILTPAYKQPQTNATKQTVATAGRPQDAAHVDHTLQKILLQIDLTADQLSAQLQRLLTHLGHALEAGVTEITVRLIGTEGITDVVIAQPPAHPNRGHGKEQGKRKGQEQAQANTAASQAGERQGGGSGRKKGSLRDVFRYIRIYWKPYVGAATLILSCQLAYKLFQTIFAYSLKVVVDNALAFTASSIAVPLLISLVLAFPVVAGLSLIGERVTARTSSRLMNDIRTDIFEHLQQLPIGFYQKTPLGNILARFSTDLFVVERGVALRFVPGVVTTASILINIPVLLWMNVPLALGTLTALPFIYMLVEQVTPRAAESNYQFKQVEAKMINVVQENVRAQPLIRSFGMYKPMTERFQTELDAVEATNTEANFDRALVENAATMSLMAVQLLSTCAGAFLVFNGAMTAGSLIAFSSVLGVVNNDLYDLFRRTLPHMVAATGGIRRIDELLQERSTIVDASDAIALPTFQEAIRFKRVSFSYDGSRNHLTNVDLTIPVGQTVAFVGPSGSGKSTILNLLLRFYDVSAGCITIDGHDVRNLQQASLRKRMGVVLQDTFLFHASVEENIRVVKPAATMDEIIAAAQAAELHEFIMSLPHGYQTTVGEAGGQLSGGQRQRIAIARALLCDPDILILDEATASLDAEIAAAIQKTIETIARTRTVISITHHLPFAMHADQIFVLEHGRLVEQGTHDRLLAQDGLYAQLWTTQVNGELGRDPDPAPIRSLFNERQST